VLSSSHPKERGKRSSVSTDFLRSIDPYNVAFYFVFSSHTTTGHHQTTNEESVKMKVTEKLAQAEREGKTYWSFEFFPPRTAQVSVYSPCIALC
jgi:hypothetical protein